MVLGLQYCLIEGKQMRIHNEHLWSTYSYPGSALPALFINSPVGKYYEPYSTNDELEAN